MKMPLRISHPVVRLVLLLCVFTSARPAVASPVETPPWSWRKGSFGLSSSTEYFWTQANFDTKRSEYTRLTGDNRLSDFRTWLRGRYAFWPKFSVYGGLGLGQTRAIDSVAERTNSGFTQAYMGGHFTVWRQWLLMVAEVEAGMPLDAGGPMVALKSPHTTALIDDGVYYGRALLHIRRDISFFRLFGYGGVYVPTGGLAKRVMYGLFGEIPLGPMMMVGGGIDGYETLFSDELTQAERNTLAATANAGSYRFRSYNPALLRAQAWFGFKPGRTVELRVGYANTIMGIREAAGQALMLNVVFDSIPKRSARARSGEAITAPGNTRIKIPSEKTNPELISPSNDFEPQNSDDLNETERLLEE